MVCCMWWYISVEVGLGVSDEIALLACVQFLEAFQKVFEGHILLCNYVV